MKTSSPMIDCRYKYFSILLRLKAVVIGFAKAVPTKRELKILSKKYTGTAIKEPKNETMEVVPSQLPHSGWVTAKLLKPYTAAMSTVATRSFFNRTLSKIFTAKTTPKIDPSWEIVSINLRVFSLIPKMSLR